MNSQWGGHVEVSLSEFEERILFLEKSDGKDMCRKRHKMCSNWILIEKVLTQIHLQVCAWHGQLKRWGIAVLTAEHESEVPIQHIFPALDHNFPAAE